MGEIHLITVTYNNEATIAYCLEAATTALQSLEHKITVVDNASMDGTVEKVRSSYPSVEVIALDENVGFGAANNIALQECNSPFALLLNPDTAIAAGAVTTLLETLKTHEDVALVGPRMEYEDGSPQVSFGSFPGLISDFNQKRLVNGCKSRQGSAISRVERALADLFSPDWVSGSCFLARHSAIREIGFFDTDFFLYLEDVDLCRRLRAYGWRVLVQPKARCVHVEGASHSDPASTRRHHRRSRLLYENKHGVRWRFHLYHFLRGRGLKMDYDPARRWTPAEHRKRK